MKALINGILILLPFSGLTQCFIDTSVNTFQTHHVGGAVLELNEFYDGNFTVYLPHGQVHHPDLGLIGSAIIEQMGIFHVSGIPEGLEYEFYLDDGTLVDTTGLNQVGAGGSISELYSVPADPGYRRVCIRIYGVPTETTSGSNTIEIGFYVPSEGVPFPLGATFMYSIDIVVAGDMYIPEICVVNTDPSTGHNQLIWNKLQSNFTDSFNIYSSFESDPNQIFYLGSVPYEDLSVFVDTINDPQSGPINYFLTIVNYDGTESELSTRHTTIHLVADSTTFDNELQMMLQWTEYYPYLNSGDDYFVYSGPSPSELTLQASVPSTFTGTFLPYSNTLTYYAIGTQLDTYCVPSRANGQSTLSNVVSNAHIVNVESIELVSLAVFPNPTSSNLNIQLPYSNFNATRIYLYDLLGCLVVEQDFKHQIDLEHLDKGMYLLVVQSHRGELRELIQKD